MIKRFLNYFPYFLFRLRKVRFALLNQIDPLPKEGFLKELKTLKQTLYSLNWNSSYSNLGIHYQLEKEFADYIGCNYAVAVNTGGMSLQMIFRALGLRPGDEVIHQVDTCIATSYAVINSYSTPVFADINNDNFMLGEESVINTISNKTKIILPVHMWGNAENMEMVTDIAKRHSLIIVEDACLSLGAESGNKKVGTFGMASAFSFGCLKPVQAGEGGIAVTNDPNLAKELRILRDWGETTQELGYRDQKQLSWNGRMSEFVAAVALEQLKRYPDYLKQLRENVNIFVKFIESIEGLSIVHTSNKSVYTQVVLKLDIQSFPIAKHDFRERLKKNNISTWHANFEPINTLTFFSSNVWRDWILKGDLDRIHNNYSKKYHNSISVFENNGIGINKVYFLSKSNLNILIKGIIKSLNN